MPPLSGLSIHLPSRLLPCSLNGRAHAQGTRDDFKSRGQRARQLAVNLNQHMLARFIGGHFDAPRARMSNFAHAEMRAQIEPVDVGSNPERVEVADGHHVEQPIVEFRFRRDLHPAAEVARVGDAQISYGETKFRPPVEP